MKHQRGFSLLEVLIALLVLSIGLLGVAAMQVKALQSATAGYQRSVATLAAIDAQERLWAEWEQLSANTKCNNIPVSEVETAWVERWNDQNSSNPLRNALWGDDASHIERDECEFIITIKLGDSPGDIATDFTYIFRLSKKSRG